MLTQINVFDVQFSLFDDFEWYECSFSSTTRKAQSSNWHCESRGPENNLEEESIDSLHPVSGVFDFIA